jgi:hypothetical protein
MITWRYFLTHGRGPEQEVTRDEYQAAAEHGRFLRLPWGFTVLDVTGRVLAVLPCNETGMEPGERIHDEAGAEVSSAA